MSCAVWAVAPLLLLWPAGGTLGATAPRVPPAGRAPATGGERELTRRDSTAAAAEPGRPLTTVVMLANETGASQRFEGRTVLPSGWRLLSGDGPVQLRPGERVARAIQLGIPSAAPAAVYEVRYELRRPGDAAASVTYRRRVRVIARRRLELVALESPRFVVAGTPYDASYLVRNGGNVAARVRVTTRGRAETTRQVRWDDRPLAIGESRTLTVTITPPAGAAEATHDVVEVRAEVEGREPVDSGATRLASSGVLVVPRSGGRTSTRHDLPLQVRLIAARPQLAGPGSPSSITGEVSGGGPLVEGGRTRLDLLARGPAPAGAPFGEREEYRVRLGSPHYELRVGDDAFVLSPLTEPGRYARGIGGRLTAGWLALGGFTARDRFASLGTEERAGSAELRFGAGASLGAHYLEKTGPDSGTLWSVRARAAPARLAALAVEVGEGTGPSAGQRARSATLEGTHPRFAYGLFATRVDTAYPGAARGLRADGANVAVRLFGPVQLRAQASERRTPEMPFALGRLQASSSRTVEGAVSVGSALSIGYEDALRVSGAPGGLLDGHESMLRLHARARLGPAAVETMLEGGQAQSALTASARPARSLAVNAGVGAGTRQWYSAYAQLSSGPRWYAPVPQDRLNVGLSARVASGAGVSLRLDASESHDLLLASRDYQLVDATLAYAPVPGYELALRGRSVLGGRGATGLAQTMAEVVYSMPLGVPVGRSRSVGRVVGRVYDAETGEGVRDALVLLGGRPALTDGDGRLAFSGVPAGTQFVQLDLGGAAVGRVASRDMPLPVEARPGRTARFDVGLVRAARVVGRVRRFAPPDDREWDGARAQLVDAGGMPGVVVALVNGGEVTRRVTDAAGAFTFADVRPGRWRLTAEGGELPPHHYFAHDTIAVDVGPAGVDSIDLELLPRKRVVHIVDEAVVVAGRSPLSRPSAAVLPAPAPPRADVPPPRHRYTVTRWDTGLSSIAGFVYGDSTLWPKLWVANRGQLRHPDVLPLGVRLVVPDSAPLTPAERVAGEALRARFPAPQVRRARATRHTFTVTRWDTDLVSIARAMYGDASLWPKIWVANRHQMGSPDDLRVGLRLVIPDPAPLTPSELDARNAVLRARQ